MKEKLVQLTDAISVISCGVCHQDAYKWCAECIDDPSVSKYTLNPIQSRVYRLLNENPSASFIVASSTGTGKTICAQMAIRKYTGDGKVYWLSPLKQLVHEQVESLKNVFPEKRILELTGDTSDDIGYGNLRNKAIHNSDIVVMSYEMFDSLTRKPSVYTAKVGLLIIDEIHSIGSISRGGKLDGAITRFMLRNTPQVIGLSATFDNVNDLQRYFRQFIDIEVLTSDFKPIKAIVDPVIHAFDRNSTNLITQIVSDYMSIDGGILVMQLSIPGCDSVARAINAAFGEGTARVHYSELDKDEKYQTIDDFNQEKFKVLACSPTLIAGINVKASVIILNLSYFDAIAMEPKVLDPSSIRQASGRVGRLPNYKQGYITYICNEDLIEQAQETIRQPNIVNGTLDKALHQVINVEVSMMSTTLDQLKTWYTKTYTAFSNPSDSGLAFDNAMEFLTKYGYIVNAADILVSTPKGKACAKYFCDPLYYEVCNKILSQNKITSTDELANNILPTLMEFYFAPANWNDRKSKSYLENASNNHMLVDRKLDLFAKSKRMQWPQPIEFAFGNINKVALSVGNKTLEYNSDIIRRSMYDSGIAVPFARLQRALDKIGSKVKSRAFMAYLLTNGVTVDDDDNIKLVDRYRTPIYAVYNILEDAYTALDFDDSESRFEKIAKGLKDPKGEWA
jgi:replicative superfamily II helicase